VNGVAARDWFRTFFDAEYVRFLRAQKSAGATRAEVAFVRKALALRPGARVLDVPCGFGRHARQLAREGFPRAAARRARSVSGFDVVGVDLSPAMIAEARRGGTAPRLHFVRGDMRRLAFDGTFDAVVNLFTSFGYFTHRENRDVLRRMARALRPGGKILIDHRDPAFDAKWRKRRDWYRGAGLFVLDEARFDPVRGLSEATWLFVRPGERRVGRRAFRVYEYTLAQWREMFRASGLRLTAAYSGYGKPYRRGTGRLIVVGTRPAQSGSRK
jgi:SAM-dependent methyltransferase